VDKIVFSNGKTVSSSYLNEVQKASKFTGDTRTDYYSDPTSGDEAGWEIGQRDGIKDWEIADPRIDQESALGRTAHDGIVLGWDEATSSVVVPGVPATRPAGAGGIGVTVEAGSFISRTGNQVSWSRQTVQILNTGANSVSYLYVLDDSSDPLTVSIGNSLPSVTEAHIPLAKITLNSTGDGLATDPLTNEVVGTGYIDLRPNTFVGNLNTYPQNLTNTPIQSANYTARSWDRVIADTSNGSIIITLPESPSDSDRFAVVDISGTFDRFPLILRINPTTSELLNNSSDDWIVNIRDAHLELFYHQATGQWKFEEAPGSECNPVLGTFLSCGGREYIGDRTALECPDGAQLPSRYPEPSAGVYSFEPSQSDPTLGKCYRVYTNTVALYANGTGGLISFAAAPRCTRDLASSVTSVTRNTIYVDPSIGDDSVGNSGIESNRPFRTLERALIEAVRESRRSGQANDRYDRVMIELAPGDYYVDNSPGLLVTPTLTDETGLIQRVSTGYSIGSVSQSDRVVHLTIDVDDPVSNQPPRSLNLGRVIYSESGGVGNISRIEKISASNSNWIVTLEYVQGTFSINDELFYDNLAAVNPQTGGLIVPRGISIDGTDLRKVRLRPMYVPELTPVQNDPQTERTAILKVTGGTYISLLTFTDNPQYPRSHNTVTSVAFASQAEINGSSSESPYYSRLNSLFKDIDGWGSEGLEAIPAETTIVAPIAGTKINRSQDTEENQTGLLVDGGDSRANAPVAYPGATRIRDTDGSILPLPDINSTRSSSPYVFNCSVRSIFGLNGLWADGGRVAGFKSMVTANFTQVSLQTDPNCYLPTTYFQDPPINKETGSGKQYKTSSSDPFKYRHFGMRGSNDATIQIVSVFVIGNSDHFVSESGADLSITNSCSDFGDISLRGIGYKSKSFSQDERTSEPGYGGTRITQIIPPLPLSYSPLADGTPPTLEDVEINTGLVIDYNKTLSYVVNNKTSQDESPSTIRIYVQNSNVASQLSLSRPPSANDIAFGQYTYTRKVSDTAWELSGGPGRPNRKRIYVNGFDEVGNSILYTGDIQLADPSGSGFKSLNDKSKIFVWDPTPADIDGNGQPVVGPGAWYVNVRTIDVLEETTDLDGDGYLLKRFDYAFRYKLLSNPSQQQAVFASLDFMFNRSAVKIVRAIDRRRAENRVYRTVLEGFIKENYGIRRPQPYYVVEKQLGVSGYPLNGSVELTADPLTVTQVLGYREVYKDAEPVSSNGKFITYLTQGTRARDVFTGDFYPDLDTDHPELTENPDNSITKIALELMKSRTGVYFSSDLIPSVTPITVKTSLSASTTGIRIGLRRPSVIRASGHTWEWTGYLNYDTAFPTFQGDPLEQDYALGKIIVEENGGRVYATGMNEEGSYYIGTTVFDLRSGEQFAIPLAAEGEAGNVTNQILSNVIVRNTLLMQDGSSLVMGNGTTLFLSNDTEFKSLTTGDIVASKNPPAVYASTAKAGLVQLADSSMIRGAKGSASTGVSDKAVVTALDLANELDIRFNSSVAGGSGVTVTSSSVELPGGDPGDPSDNITQFGINIGLPLNTEIVPFAGIKLGSGTSQQITSTVTSNVGISKTQGSDEKVATEKAIAIFVQSFVNQAIPIGAIIMWSGSTAPTGWQLCDFSDILSGPLAGQKTPDLRDRFVVGTGTSYAIGDTGGSNTVTLTEQQMPVHNHSITDPGHAHSISQINGQTGLGSSGNDLTNDGTPLSNPISTDSNTTGITATNNAGGLNGETQAHENRPPYYALAFIMRVS
jgi:microcystin-dependent protein